MIKRYAIIIGIFLITFFVAPIFKNQKAFAVAVPTGFTKITAADGFVLDMRYATTNNFTHKKVYTDSTCMLRASTIKKLKAANKALLSKGFKLKIWDAYRPLSVQVIFWNLVHDSRFVANPATGGSVHNKGCAVDVTLTDLKGKELLMPSGFDDFSTKAYRNSSGMSAAARTNLKILTEAMTSHGFTTISTEWWHYDDIDKNKYSVK